MNGSPPYLLSRRRLLALTGAGGLAVALAGCTSGGPTTALATPPPDQLGGVLERHRALRAAYEAAIAGLPDLSGQLEPLRVETDAHVSALEQALARPKADATTPAAAPGGAGEALAALAQAEQAAADELIALVPAAAARRAPLLGSIAASCACHVELLS